MARRDESVSDDAAFSAERRIYLVSALAIVLGVALVGSLERHRELAGGALLTGWIVAVYALHRLGRVGSKR